MPNPVVPEEVSAVARSGVTTCLSKSRSNEILIEYYYCHIANTVLGSTQSRSRQQRPRRLRRVQVDTEMPLREVRERTSMLDDGFSPHDPDVRPRRERVLASLTVARKRVRSECFGGFIARQPSKARPSQTSVATKIQVN